MKIEKSSKSVSYLSNLDPLRFLAFFVVFINHVVACLGHRTSNTRITEIKTKYLLNGDLGVNFFFVLSGFLITYLLLKEKENYNKINTSSFYFRRIVRIWPLYYLVLFIGVVIIPYFLVNLPAGFPVSTGTTIMNKELYVFFLGNFDYVKNGISNAVVGVLWSVSIEEQFYLFWPLIIAIIPGKHLVKAFIAIIVLSISYKLYGTSGKTLNLMLKYHTFSCISDLAMGALFAKLCLNENILSKFENMKRYWIVIFYVIGISLILVRVDLYSLEPINKLHPRESPHLLKSIMPTIYSLFFAFIVIEQAFAKRSLFKTGRIAILNRLGKISYGLYCFHMIAMATVVYIFMKFDFKITGPDKWLVLSEALATLALTITLAHFSYKYFESFFLKFKKSPQKK